MGPFVGYAPPGTYTSTFLDQPIATLLANLRVPALIGTAEEVNLLDGYEMVRGSSPTIDQKVTEDVSSFFDGMGNLGNRTFTTFHKPIVTGDGSGTITNKANNIVVKVDGIIAIVASIVGLSGTVVLALAPNPTGTSNPTVTIAYFYKRTDTRILNENLSDQADGSTTTFYVANEPIVDGSNAGRVTTNVSDVKVKVSNSFADVIHLDGANGAITLATAPALNATVTVTYFFNQYPNTSDDLPVAGLTQMIRVGYSPETSDFIEDVDFAIIDDQIQWGTGWKLVPDPNDSGIFNDNMIVVSVFDNKKYKEDVSSQFTGTENFCTVSIIPIVNGTARQSTSPQMNPIDIYTVDQTSVVVKVNGTEVDVRRVQGDIGKITLVSAPAPGSTVTVTYWYSRIIDGQYNVEVITAGGQDVGQYHVWYNDVVGNQIDVGNVGLLVTDQGKFYSDSLPTIPLDYAIDENVTITVTSSLGFAVTSDQSAGSNGYGTVGSTYIDVNTGLFFTLDESVVTSSVTIQMVIEKAAAIIPVSSTLSNTLTSIPGATVDVLSTENAFDPITAAGDLTKLYIFNKSGKEPAVSDVYYVTYTYVKTDFEPAVFTQFKDVTNEYGALSENNSLVLAAYLAMLNGATALICYQVRKGADSEVAPDQYYFDALDVLKSDVSGVAPSIVFPVTSSQSVIEYTTAHVTQMSSKRYRRERTSFFGYAVGTEPLDAANFAASINNQRMLAVYPDGATIQLVDTNGVATDHVIEGSYLAAAMVGLNVNSMYDVATPMTRKQLVGLKQLVRTLDEPTMDMVAIKGVTIITQNFTVRHSLSTNMSNIITSDPAVTTISDFIQQQTRQVLDPFIGRKIVDGFTNDVARTDTAMLRAAKQAQIISNYTPATAVRDPNNPKMINVSAYYVPVFGCDWILVEYGLRTS
jgi:hypothetical protein